MDVSRQRLADRSHLHSRRTSIFPHRRLVIVLNGAGSAQDRPNLWKVSNIMNEASLIRLLRQGVIDSMLAYSERFNGTKRHHRIPRTG